MRRSALVLASALGAISATALAADPCAPPPARPVHVAAFAAPGPATPASSPAPAATSDELALQAGCLAWEASHARQAEPIGTAPLGPMATARALVVTGASVAVLSTRDAPLPFLAGSVGAVPPGTAAAPESSRAFSLCVSLLAPR